MFEVLYFVVASLIGIGIFEEVLLPTAVQAFDLAKPVVEQAINLVTPTE